MATAWHEIHETTNLKRGAIVFTEGSTIRIDAPAKMVFDVILDFDKYHEWNGWCPKFEFKQGEEKIQVGSQGIMHVNMEKQSKVYQIPEEILELDYNPREYKMAWVGKLLPTWAGKAERVQLVTPINETQCELKQWESMSGFASYIFKHLMGVPKQLEEQNVRYAQDVKARAEKVYSDTTATS